MAASAEIGMALSLPVAVDGSTPIGAVVGVGFVDGADVGAAGVGVGVGVGAGVATGHTGTVKICVFEMVTWLLVSRTNAVKVPAPIVNVALTFWSETAVTLAIWDVPPAAGVTTIWCGRPGVTPVALITAWPQNVVAVTTASVDGAGTTAGGGGGVPSPVPPTVIGAVGPDGATGIAPASPLALLK